MSHRSVGRLLEPKKDAWDTWSRAGAKFEREPLDEQFHVFVLKLWCEHREGENACCVWRGSILNAVTRHTVYFNDLPELTASLATYMAAQARERDPRLFQPDPGQRNLP